MSTLYFIRHGQASFGKADYDALSVIGRQQARILAEHLERTGVLFDVVLTGTLKRQMETARALLDRITEKGGPQPEVRQWPAFNEYDSEAILKGLVPIVAGKDRETGLQTARMFSDKRSFQIIFEKVMQAWVSGDHHAPGLETWPDFTKRVAGAIDKIMVEDGKGRNIALFTSGGPISAAVQKALSLSNAETIRLSWQLANASISRFKYTPDRMTLSTFNEHGHLEVSGEDGMVTYR